MKAVTTWSGKPGDEIEVQVTMTKREAEDLSAFLDSEKRRRWKKFNKTDLMQCWICLGACENLLRNLGRIGIGSRHL